MDIPEDYNGFIYHTVVYEESSSIQKDSWDTLKHKKMKENNHGTVEDYILKIIEINKAKLKSSQRESIEFYSLASQIDILYTVLTGWNNPQSNPIINNKLSEK